MVDLKISVPEGFLEAEDRDGYYVSKKTKELWAVELDLLAEFVRVCQKYNLRYFADSGTLLGAVRHGGFIPWDDDIDIVMPREDYYRLCKVASEEFMYPYFFQTEETDPGSLRMHAQLRNSETTGILSWDEGRRLRFNQGIFIDILPLDNVPDAAEERHELGIKLENIKQRMLLWADATINYGGRYAYRIMKGYRHDVKVILFHNTVVKFTPKAETVYKQYYRSFEHLRRKYNKTSTRYFANYGTLPGRTKGFLRKSDYTTDLELPFEFMKIKVPAGYANTLTSHYGNWEKAIQQKNTHGDLIFDTVRSYCDYMNRE